MDRKVLDEVQETIDEKLGTGYRLHSFVDAGNTDVNEVQFVYVVDGVEDASDSDDATTETAADTEDDLEPDLHPAPGRPLQARRRVSGSGQTPVGKPDPHTYCPSDSGPAPLPGAGLFSL